MNLAEFSIRKSTVTWFFTVLIVIGGIWAYGGLGKLEDPAFTIKTAVIITPYPGASPLEVENEVTSLIESAAQKLGQTDKVRSLSKEGLSMVYVDIKPVYTARDLPQIWDELRRKVTDAQGSLPPGAGPSRVNDDYGDFFGVYYASKQGTPSGSSRTMPTSSAGSCCWWRRCQRGIAGISRRPSLS